MNRFVFVGACALAAAASADIRGNAIDIAASSDAGQGTWRLLTEDLNYNPDQDRWWWQSDGPLVIRDATGAPLVTFDNLAISFVEDPVISLGFLATAGGVNTRFTISSGILGFAPGLYTAQASSSITTTDTDGNGATTTGHFGINDTYQALCNGASIGTSTPGIAVGPFGSTPSAGAIGPANYFANSMQAQWDFTLSANDSASGTSVYVKTLVPAPGTMGLLALGGLAAARRRRA